MAKQPRPWIVLPHGPIERIEDNLWAASGTLGEGKVMPRRMVIVRRDDGRLVFHNAIPLEEGAMKELEGFGEPAFLLVPNAFHRMDIHAFKARYPGMKLLCPAAAHDKINQVAAVDGHYEDFPADPAVRIEPLDGVKNGEAAVVVKSGAKTSLLFNDVMMNLPHLPGFQGFIFRMLGSTGGPKVTGIARMVMVGDKKKLRAHLERLADTAGLTHILVAHGAIISIEAPAVLRAVAAAL